MDMDKEAWIEAAEQYALLAERAVHLSYGRWK
jgi:hypothetical protein